DLWRTQLLSGAGTSLVLTALFGLTAQLVRRPTLKAVVFVSLAAAVTYFGSLAALQRGLFFRTVWERHRAAVLHVLRVAPNVNPNTIVSWRTCQRRTIRLLAMAGGSTWPCGSCIQAPVRAACISMKMARRLRATASSSRANDGDWKEAAIDLNC